MIKVGITGQTGFMGTHLFNFLGLQKDIERVPFKDEYFSSENELQNFVKQCDAIVHLAAMNRHGDPQVIYDTNIKLVEQLLQACDATHSIPHILFSSSTQENRGNLYGKSKLDGRKMLENWSKKNGAVFTGLIIPNVYGPFGNPYYNSFIATFCHQLTHNEEPKIEIDGSVKLIYVGELVQIFHQIIKEGSKSVSLFPVEHTKEITVSQVLEILKKYKSDYFEKGIIPDLNDSFRKNLFNTFLCYIDHETFFPFNLKSNTDTRGSFVETMKLNSGGQVSFSTTVPGITRGNHFHTRKAERFAVIKGQARIELRRIGTDKVLSFELDGKEPAFVDMPVWFTHNITNIGDEELFTIFWINEHYNAEDPDTFFEKV